ncbi:MAG: hsp90 co-chaperone Cdc37 [Phylliscum demangeonii]|nr:MAG: hsp90 co-chaperone Cdc37 [Phylliscum demangeonii]
MALNYSKWDNLELSDDSDIEVHPNVDKRSFIRAKQNQIHQQRDHRRKEIEWLKRERIINDGLLGRIDKLLNALQAHGSTTGNADERVFQALVELGGDPASDQPPPRPKGSQDAERPQPSYSQMMAALVDQVKGEVKEPETGDRLQAYIDRLKVHQAEVRELQKDLLKQLAGLEQEESKKITSEGLHTGFDSSFVSRPAKKASAQKTPSTTPSTTTTTVEVLNPSALDKDPKDGAASEKPAKGEGDDAKDDDDDDDEDEHIECSPLGKEFGKIKMGDYRACAQFIIEHPEVLAPGETDGLLLEAFNSQLAGNSQYAQQCVHQGLALQYCRSLGPGSAEMFFKGITTKGHQAQGIFFDDVRQTYARIRTRAYDLAAERAANAGGKEVERIQLHTVEPGSKITINIPHANSEDPAEQDARAVFEHFSPAMRKALEVGSLERVNNELGKMSVPEAEEVVGLLGEKGMLGIDKDVIDATTEEGKQKWKEIESEMEKAAARAEEGQVADEAGDDEVGEDDDDTGETEADEPETELDEPDEPETEADEPEPETATETQETKTKETKAKETEAKETKTSKTEPSKTETKKTEAEHPA